MRKSLAASVFIALTTIPFVIRYILGKKYQKLGLKLQEQDENSYYQCIFFDYKNFYCKPHLINRSECGEQCSYLQLERLLKFIGSAKNTINICVYMITLKQISAQLVTASKRGVKVRVITDKAMSKTIPAHSNLQYFERAGIKCKMPHSGDVMMHHKFCLIDEGDLESGKVFFGSVNLTAQALCKNFEALILSNNREIIRRLSEEFEELWEIF